MTGLPATGASWEQVLEPNLNPLAVRYWQVTDVLIMDYLTSAGAVVNLANPSVGVGTAQLANGTTKQLFTPFAADGITLRQDILTTSPQLNSALGTGFYHIGLLKEDTTAVTPDQTMQETPSAQQVRTARNVLTKLDDKIEFQPLETTPLITALNYEWPLCNGVPQLGTPGLGMARGNTDVPVERIIVLIGVDTDGQLMARCFARTITDKKAKAELARKNPYSSMLTYAALPDPYSGQAEWTFYAGSAWNSSGDFKFDTFAPQVTPIAGLKATVLVPTPVDVKTPTWTANLQQTANGAFTAASSVTAVVNGGWTTLTVSGLTASQQYNALEVVATGSNITETSPVSAPFTALAS